tara:strand:- start:1099 stop:1449 length:351 start_codon:yes stop_codon:yes gene_type:complete
MTAALKIASFEKDGEDLIVVAAQIEDRFQHHGFGTFMCDVEQDEVEITPEALKLILQQPERSGLQGLEFWADFRIAWGDPSPQLIIPCEDISVPDEAKEWVRERFKVVAMEEKLSP